jgi:hypothetical protein
VNALAALVWRSPSGMRFASATVESAGSSTLIVALQKEQRLQNLSARSATLYPATAA